MRLINTKTLELETFISSEKRPAYAILSHRWVDGQEVTFQDMQHSYRQWIPGWSKIRSCCKQASAEGLKYVWVDTCCINKESSSELSEAINSMYNWYSNAVICYAHLNDVHKFPSEISLSMLADAITKSTWFTRAWTLQELIAPINVSFFDSEFHGLGNKTDLADKIEAFTGIPTDVLLRPSSLASYPIAVKMAWAASREATRTEDIAYSLFGLFEVNLPLLYGEGSRAFVRSQEEIIRQTNDHSIFLWCAQPLNEMLHSKNTKRLSVLAPAPANFKSYRNITRMEEVADPKPYAMTNIGLQIELPLFPYCLDTYVALLDCKGRTKQTRYGILLARDGDTTARWYRTCFKNLDVVKVSDKDVLSLSSSKKIHIMRGRPEESIANANSKVDAEAQESQPNVFYGLRINAPRFLEWSAGTIRPYAVVSYHDWEAIPAMDLVEHESVQRQSGRPISGESLLSPSSFKQFSLFYTQFDPVNRLFEAGLTLDDDASGRKRPLTGNNSPQTSRLRIQEGTEHTWHRGLPAKSIGTFEMPIMTTGICGIVFFDHLMHGLRAMKVGFDFDFHPVVFIATDKASSDSQIENWMRQWRFKDIKTFESSPYLQRDLRDQDEKNFWKLQPDLMRTQPNLRLDCTGDDDLPMKIDEGIYGFRSSSSADANHWTFKPYENEGWHIVFGLEKRVIDGVTTWELNMHRRDEVLEVNVQISNPG